MRFPAWLLGFGIAAGCLARVAEAQGAEPPAAAVSPDATRVVVVDVRAGAAHLDAAKLRAAIASELHAEAIAPGEPRASEASGTLTIDLDQATDRLVVSYLARGIPTQRLVPLPPESAAARRAVVALAGNLARDEAGELAAALRPKAEAHVPAAAPPSPGQTPEEIEARAAGRLRRLLQHHKGTSALGDSLQIGAASGAFGVGMAAVLQVGPGWDTPGEGAMSVLSVVALSGASFPLQSVGSWSFATLAEYAEEHSASETEAMWRKLARRERTWRHVSGGVAIGASVLATTLAVASFAEPDPSDGTSSAFSSVANQHAFGGIMVATAVVSGVVSIVKLGARGPVERALGAYEITSGREHEEASAFWERSLGAVQVSPAPGGATAGISLSF